MDVPKEALSAEGIEKNFSFEAREINVLKGVDMTVRPGELIGIVGASGTGKSTLLHILGGLDKPSAGRVRVGGDDLFSLGDDRRSSLRGRKIGFVFQFHHLLPEFSALENVLIPTMIAGDGDGAEERARDLFRLVGLADRMDHRPGKLSGGEQQRVAIIRALINEPDLLLADEPTGNLDEKTAEEVFALVSLLVKERGLASVVVTHNHKLTGGMDAVYELHGGRLTPMG